MAHKAFGSTSHALPEAATFELSGMFVSSGEGFTEKFTCQAVIPPGVLVDLVGAFGPVDDDGNRKLNVAVINDFFAATLDEESGARFAALIRDKNRVVEIDTLGEIVMWLSEEVLGRPTTQ